MNIQKLANSRCVLRQTVEFEENIYTYRRRDGKCHRDGGLPAFFSLSDNRTRRNRQNVFQTRNKYHEWYDNGVNHRDDDLPAIVEYGGNFKDYTRWWYRHGKRHRDYKPAMRSQGINGQYYYHNKWYQHGVVNKHCDR